MPALRNRNHLAPVNRYQAIVPENRQNLRQIRYRSQQIDEHRQSQNNGIQTTKGFLKLLKKMSKSKQVSIFIFDISCQN